MCACRLGIVMRGLFPRRTDYVGATMKPLPHRYDVHLTGGPAGYAALSTAGVSDLRRRASTTGRATRGVPSTFSWPRFKPASCSRFGQSHGSRRLSLSTRIRLDPEIVEGLVVRVT